MGVIRAPYSDHQCPWYHLSGKMNFCVIGIEMGTENALPLSTELPAPPECGQHPWWSGAWTITWPPERGSQNESGLPPRIWSTVPPTTHQYSQRIEALRTVLKWRHLWLSLSTASAQPSCVYQKKNEELWLCWINEANCVRLLWLPLIPKYLHWLWETFTQIDF